MNLYEISNGWVGQSHCHVYCWAASESDAMQMAFESFRTHKPDHPEYCQRLQIRFLFAATAPAFCTEPSDEGWPD